MPDEPKPEAEGGKPSPGPDAPLKVDAGASVDAPPADAGLPVPPDENAEKNDAEDERDDAIDAASPAAILKRVSALDEDDASERIAREEEEKLAARKSAGKKPKKKSALESSASKRLSKIGEKAPVRRSVAVAADADPLVDRAVDWSKWAKKNQALVQGAALAAFVALAGGIGYIAYERKHEAQASVELAKAIEDEHGRIGDPDKDDDDSHLRDPTPIFKTVEERREAALAEYRAVESKFHGTGAAILARLAEGGILLDKEDADGALAAYREVSTSPLAKADGEVRGRSLEGMGFAYELKADAGPSPDLLESAGQEYRELENTDVMGFKELGMYHEARVLSKQGKKDDAIALLKKLHERLKSGDVHAFIYLEQVADDALRALDPQALPPKLAPGMSGLGGRGAGKGGLNKLTPEQLQKLYEQLQKNGAGGGAPH